MLFNNTNMRTAMAYTNAVGDKVYPIIVDIKKGIKSTEEVSFVSSDINTGVLSVAFIQGNDTYNVEGAEVICSIMRPDTTTLEIPCNIINGNTIEVPLGVNGTSQDGVYSFDFKVFKGGNKIVGTPIMNYSVSLSISNDLVVEEDDRLPVLTMLMTQVNELKEETRETINQANVATVASKEATAKAIVATNNANAVSERVSQETSEAISRVDNKVNEVETRFNRLTSSQQQSSEVIDARDGETSLKARLDRDIEKAKQVYVNVEGSHISTDSSVGYAKYVEILGNTIQDASNLADIRSVGDKVEGQELYEIPVLSVGKNLINGKNYTTAIGIPIHNIGLKDGNKYTLSFPIATEIKVSVKGNSSSHGEDTLAFSSREKKLTFTYNSLKKWNIFIWKDISWTEYVNEDIQVQLEEGTVATPYEPYQEDKLTILSPVQLEKVGDVADRIICKDGVWGIEKWIKTMYTKEFAKGIGTYEDKQNTFKWSKILDTLYTNVIANFMQVGTLSTESTQTQLMIHNHGTNRELRLAFKKSDFPNFDVIDNVISYLSEENRYIKIVQQPQFIPLPHDQQIKLRTFANKTNILFLTEIEGTIKAQVPKSLGATVNTHTEQIRSLNNELNRVKKLEESTVSTVTTESDFTTVTETANGYFEDVKLEGKTLVNLADYNNRYVTHGVPVDGVYTKTDSESDFNIMFKPTLAKINTKYTMILDVLECDDTFLSTAHTIVNYSADSSTNHIIKKLKKGANLVLLETSDTLKNIFFHTQLKKGTCKIKIVILEGDHTQNPPSYFEGLKSVGQSTSEDGVDEIVVSSVNKNLDEVELLGQYRSYSNGVIDTNVNFDGHLARVKPNALYRIRTNGVTSSEISNLCFFDKEFKFIKGIATQVFDIITPNNCYYLTIAVHKDLTNIQIEQGEVVTEYTPHQSDKKRLLYYNTETQTWEKPILREWDSIEKHADGKYYYHQRSGEIVLNGSENWKEGSPSQFTDTHMFFACNSFDNLIKTEAEVISDKFVYGATWDMLSRECIDSTTESSKLRIRISKSKLSTQDVQGFKQWLQANNVTVVYQLAQEKVYECTNIDLITYANETNYVVESGAIVPRTTLKVHNNISNVVKILQEKVSLLENKFIEGLKKVLAGDMYSLAELLYPEDFVEESPENEIMLLPFE